MRFAYSKRGFTLILLILFTSVDFGGTGGSSRMEKEWQALNTAREANSGKCYFPVFLTQ